MSKPISKFGICCATGFSILSNYANARSAVSHEAEVAQQAATQVVISAERSHALFGEQSFAISQLYSLARESFESKVSDPDHVTIESLVLCTAESFLRALPPEIPMPELAVEPDGSITFDWIQSKNRMFSLSVSGRDSLSYAWLDGSDKGYAVTAFDRQTIPERIIKEILCIVQYGDTFLWAA